MDMQIKIDGVQGEPSKVYEAGKYLKIEFERGLIHVSATGIGDNRTPHAHMDIKVQPTEDDDNLELRTQAKLMFSFKLKNSPVIPFEFELNLVTKD